MVSNEEVAKRLCTNPNYAKLSQAASYGKILRDNVRDLHKACGPMIEASTCAALKKAVTHSIHTVMVTYALHHVRNVLPKVTNLEERGRQITAVKDKVNQKCVKLPMCLQNALTELGQFYKYKKQMLLEM